MRPFIERIILTRNAADMQDVDPDHTQSPYAGNVPCDIVSVKGDETYRGRQVEKYTDYVVETPFDNGIEPDMRVVVSTGIHKGEVLKIQHVKQIPYRNGMPPETWLYCARSTAAAGDG